jgi:hypothetical protein
MNKDYLTDKVWLYYHSISVDASRIWRTGEFKTLGEEKYFYDLIIDAVREKQKIQDIYNF